MTTYELKKYLSANNRLLLLLKDIGCHHIVSHSGYISCGNIDGDNIGAINIYIDSNYLKVVNYTRSRYFDDSADIYTLVQYNRKKQGYSGNFYDVIIYIHNLFGLDIDNLYNHEKKEETHALSSIFERLRNLSRRKLVDVEELKEINEVDYVPYVHIDFFREGIIKKTIEKFGLCYSFKRQRTMIPLRYWSNGKLLGYNGRTSVKNANEFGIKKYYITSGYKKAYNLYGLWENKESIEKADYIVLYEAEKSVLKRDSLGDSTGVALQGHDISYEQVRIILSLNVKEVIIAMDNDIPEEEIWYLCEKFYHYKKVSYICDKYQFSNGKEIKLLGEKDSPADAKNDVFKFMFDHRWRYGEREHEKYFKRFKK